MNTDAHRVSAVSRRVSTTRTRRVVPPGWFFFVLFTFPGQNNPFRLFKRNVGEEGCVTTWVRRSDSFKTRDFRLLLQRPFSYAPTFFRPSTGHSLQRRIARGEDFNALFFLLLLALLVLDTRTTITPRPGTLLLHLIDSAVAYSNALSVAAPFVRSACYLHNIFVLLYYSCLSGQKG